MRNCEMEYYCQTLTANEVKNFLLACSLLGFDYLLTVGTF